MATNVVCIKVTPATLDERHSVMRKLMPSSSSESTFANKRINCYPDSIYNDFRPKALMYRNIKKYACFYVYVCINYIRLSEEFIFNNFIHIFGYE